MNEYTVSVTFDEEEIKKLDYVCEKAELSRENTLKWLALDDYEKDVSNGQMRYVIFEVSEETIHKLNELCEFYGMDREHMVRFLIREYARREGIHREGGK